MMRPLHGARSRAGLSAGIVSTGGSSPSRPAASLPSEPWTPVVRLHSVPDSTLPPPSVSAAEQFAATPPPRVFRAMIEPWIVPGPERPPAAVALVLLAALRARVTPA